MRGCSASGTAAFHSRNDPGCRNEVGSLPAAGTRHDSACRFPVGWLYFEQPVRERERKEREDMLSNCSAMPNGGNYQLIVIMIGGITR